MKKRETLLACLFFMMVFGKLNAANGGPDAFGYTWKDSNEPGGPIPIWLDTNANSIRVLNLGDDNSVGMFDMVWNFRYYLGTYHSIKIGSNGWVSFDNIGNIAHCFPTIPTRKRAR
jgi:hypothetical protein